MPHDSEYIQIDLMEINQEKNICRCTMYTPEGDVRIYMALNDVERLKRNGFFVRKENTPDSANVLNTTLAYYPKQ